MAEIVFLGRGGGQVKSLGGFKKGHHTVPDAANAATQAFLGKVCGMELAEQSEQLFQSVRAALGYKRAEITLSVASPMAVLTARDFVVELSYALEPADPSRYGTTLALRGLTRPELVRTEPFERVFARRFSELSFALIRGVQVEAVIDAIESLEDGPGLSVNYPSDCHECEITVPTVDAKIRCTAAALDLVFPQAGSPAALVDAFVAVRDAFAVSPALAGLIAG